MLPQNQDQADLGIGQQPGIIGNPKRIVSPPSGQGSITVEGLELNTYPRKRKVSVLTPDNANAVLSSCFNIRHLMDRLSDEPGITLEEEVLFAVMKECVKDAKTIDFSSVTQRHLDLLGLNIVLDLELDPAPVKATNSVDSSSNKIIHKDLSSYFHKHFNVSRESGCRCIIDQYLFAAVVYAQGILDNDQKMKQSVGERFGVQNPQIAVFTELAIPHTRITLNNTFYVFHGSLDYGIGFIKGRDVASLRRGTLKLNPSKMLSGILEAKSLTEMQNAEGQITVQVLIILTLTGRKFFTGALTNGALWRFFVAHFGKDQLKVFSSAELATDTDEGLIIELLKDMMLYEISPLFTNLVPSE